MMTPPVIEGFEIVGLLGQGGMATVWKARQRSLNRLVAIKVLSANVANEPDDLLRFCEEARATAKISHPGIVQAYDAVFAEKLYFVMELIDGYTVGQWLRRKGSIPFPEALLVAESVAAALDYAWEQIGMIHCDLKPDNIMVDADGTVKVADLGLSQRHLVQMDLTDEVLGTPHYMSPEQIQGGALDCRSDIYAMGATLYHMLTGRFLFDGKPTAVLDAHLEKAAPSLRQANPKIPAGVALLVEKMLSKSPQDRQQNWRQVVDDLQRIGQNLPPADVSAACVSSMERDAKTDAVVRSINRKIVWKKHPIKRFILGAR
jgi:eukaryotic-like serine/threonine-protein kinase